MVLGEIRWQSLRSASDLEQDLPPHLRRAGIFPMDLTQFPINRRQFVGRQFWQFRKNFTNAHERSLSHKSPQLKNKFSTEKPQSRLSG